MSEVRDGVVYLTADEAEAALRDAARYREDDGRTLVHCFLGFIGADWDLDDVLAELPDARDIAWLDDIFGHDLAVLTNTGRLLRFEVKSPERVRAEAGS